MNIKWKEGFLCESTFSKGIHVLSSMIDSQNRKDAERAKVRVCGSASYSAVVMKTSGISLQDEDDLDIN